MMELENSSQPSNAMEPLLRIILENSVDILMPLDRQGAILYAPTLVKDMLEYRPEELSGKSFIDIIHSDDHPAWKAAL
jgi:PAS domain S-box-containing protein